MTPRPAMLVLPALLAFGCVLGTPYLGLALQAGADSEAALRRAGRNRPELSAFLAMYPSPGQRREAAQRLAAALPPADAASLTAGELAEHLDIAFFTWENAPWGNRISWPMFCDHVLPHRITQEPHQPWRKELHTRLWPLVHGANSAYDAALRVYQWVHENSAYFPTAAPDQGVLDTLARGGGRCEELAGLAIAALRSVGLPARYVITPAWNRQDGNHAWPEVWTGRFWQPLEGGLPALEPQRPWLAENIRNTVLLLSPTYGKALYRDQPVYRERSSYTLYNLTPEYMQTGRLQTQVFEPNGAPAAGADLYVSVFNAGGFRPVARLRCDSQGRARGDFGGGSVLLTAVRAGRMAGALVDLAPGKHSQSVLRLGDGPPQLENVRLSVGSLEHAHKGPEPEAQHIATLQEETRQSRNRHTRTARARLHTLLPCLGLDEETASSVSGLLAQAGPARSAAMEALLRACAEEKPVLAALLLSMPPKDIASCTADELISECRAAVHARRLARELWDLVYEAEMFLHNVLPARSWRFAQAGLEKQQLQKEYGGLRRDSVKDTAAAVNRAVSSMATTSAFYFGPPATPEQALTAGVAQTPAIRAVTAVALLRSFGVPARYLENWGWAEWFDGREWSPLYPDLPGALGDKTISATAKAVYGESAVLRLRLSRDGESVAPVFGRDFTVCYAPGLDSHPGLRRQAGVELAGFARLWPGPYVCGEHDAEDAVVLQLPPGRYTAAAGMRSADGSAVVSMRQTALSPGEEKELRFTLFGQP